jgi:hypothetical protein
MAAKKTLTAKSTVSAQQRDLKSKASSPKRTGAGEETVTLDRRRTSRRAEEAEDAATEPPQLERRKKVQRRRQIDPTTCERDYSVEEVEFMNAMDEYKRKSGRMFPTCSEVLEVIRSLGYVRLSPAGRSMLAEPITGAEELQPSEAEAFALEGAAF